MTVQQEESKPMLELVNHENRKPGDRGQILWCKKLRPCIYVGSVRDNRNGRCEHMIAMETVCEDGSPMLMPLSFMYVDNWVTWGQKNEGV